MIDSIWVSTAERQLLDLHNSVDSLQFQLLSLQTKSDLLSGIIETSNDSIANQLSAANNLLALVAIVIAVGGTILGIYIGKKKLEVEEMVKTVEEKKKTVDAIADTTKSLDEQINSNVKGLYQQLRKEETNALLDRLLIEPEDISNLIRLLLARDLDEEGFAKLREAYLKLEAEPEVAQEEEPGFIRIGVSSKEEYMILFFQHFCYQSIKDDQIRPSLVNFFHECCNIAFKRDIIKTTIDICKALSEETSTFNKEEVLTAYLKALNGCKHRDLEELKNILEQNIRPQSLLEKAKEQCTKDGEYLSIFGITKPDAEVKQQGPIVESRH